MEKLILDPTQQSLLNGVTKQVPVCDQAGKVLGFFLPPALYKKLAYQNAEVPFTEEELQIFRQSGAPCSLDDIGKKWASNEVNRRLAQGSARFARRPLHERARSAPIHRCGKRHRRATSHDPYAYSESRGTDNQRILIFPPLGVAFDVSDDDRLVTVYAVWVVKN